jgi:hypothetical protein
MDQISFSETIRHRMLWRLLAESVSVAGEEAA